MSVRPATDAESNIVFGFFEEFASGSSQELFDEQDLWIVENDKGGRVVTVASMDLPDLPASVIAQSDHIGMRIGNLEGLDFHLDIQGASLLATVSRSKSVRVNEQAARMFLYGHDILGGSVLMWPRGLDRGDACIVVNARWEALGIGEAIYRTKGERPAVTPIHDLGTYLRDQVGE